MKDTNDQMERVRDRPKGFRHLVASTHHSLDGMRAAFSEAAFRQELVLGLVHFVALFALPLPGIVRLVLSFFWILVICVEVLNTAIESVVDLVSPGWNQLAKRAKDLGSAAVFCSLVAFVSAWSVVVIKLIAVGRF